MRAVYGFYYAANGAHYILDDMGATAVDKDTLGEYIGIDDANGNKLFTGDVVCDVEECENGVVLFDERDAAFVIKWEGMSMSAESAFGCIVVGNIYDDEKMRRWLTSGGIL